VSNDGKTLTLNTAATYQSSYISIPVLPNNRYLLSLDKSADARISYGENYNSSTVLTNNPTTLDNHIDIITSDKTNALMIYLTNSTPGIFTFSNLSLKLKM
jgi:hypothetical protein